LILEKILSTAETPLNNKTCPDVMKRSPLLRVEIRLLVIESIDNIAIIDVQIIITTSQMVETIF
jgi:hypothetical protein